MNKTLSAILSSSVILISVNASADRDYAAQAMERHGMEKPVSMPVMNVVNVVSTREALDSITVPTKQEELEARMEELAERREN
ncbi:hypothetical protein ACTL6P_24000 [Endozoicomonas acroporae]|uniref:hypothetical protein n=1 Tax=Endozoicomonas acroporae TaxID=1701104 RepID=UPI000C7865D5|nr:hypothetical protein [Endozoicomonas acroporae]